MISVAKQAEASDPSQLSQGIGNEYMGLLNSEFVKLSGPLCKTKEPQNSQDPLIKASTIELAISLSLDQYMGYQERFEEALKA